MTTWQNETPGSYIVSPADACANVRGACGVSIRTQPNGVGLVFIGRRQVGAVSGRFHAYANSSLTADDYIAIECEIARWKAEQRRQA